MRKHSFSITTTKLTENRQQQQRTSSPVSNSKIRLFDCVIQRVVAQWNEWLLRKDTVFHVEAYMCL